ncbi:MAG: hypothetical protein C4345_00395 [Chloroflexota bacterium]
MPRRDGVCLSAEVYLTRVCGPSPALLLRSPYRLWDRWITWGIWWAQRAEEPIIPGPSDQRPLQRRDDVQVYTSRPLDQAMEVTGPLEIVLYAASSAPDTDFTVKLIDVYPNEYAMNLYEGINPARYRTTDTRPEQ